MRALNLVPPRVAGFTAFEDPELRQTPTADTGTSRLRQKADTEDGFAAQNEADVSHPGIFEQSFHKLHQVRPVPLRRFYPEPVLA